MKRLFLIASFVVGTYDNALATVPVLEFEQHNEFNDQINLKEVNDEIMEFLAKNLLLDKADILVRETSETVQEGSSNNQLTKDKLESIHSHLKSQSILARDKLDRNFSHIEKLLEKYPSSLERTPLGERIIIQTQSDNAIEVSFVINS